MHVVEGTSAHNQTLLIEILIVLLIFIEVTNTYIHIHIYTLPTTSITVAVPVKGYQERQELLRDREIKREIYVYEWGGDEIRP